jgi:NAD+ kinase
MQQLLDKLTSEGVEISFYKHFGKYLNDKVSMPADYKVFTSKDELSELNLLLSIGGDGTFLKTIRLVRDSGVPILGINAGRLGFLSYVSEDKIAESIDLVLAGKYSVKERNMISASTDAQLFGEVNYGLNEVSIHKKDSSSMIIIHVSIDDSYLNSYWADGLIIATPTGSTAYSMSCGGPILAPSSGCFVITPKAPHNLTVTPLVVPDTAILKIRIEGRDVEQCLVSMDSRSETMTDQETLVVKKAGFPIRIVRPEGSSFYRTMRHKLKWGDDIRN